MMKLEEMYVRTSPDFTDEQCKKVKTTLFEINGVTVLKEAQVQYLRDGKPHGVVTVYTIECRDSIAVDEVFDCESNGVFLVIDPADKNEATHEYVQQCIVNRGRGYNVFNDRNICVLTCGGSVGIMQLGESEFAYQVGSLQLNTDGIRLLSYEIESEVSRLYTIAPSGADADIVFGYANAALAILLYWQLNKTVKYVPHDKVVQLSEMVHTFSELVYVADQVKKIFEFAYVDNTDRAFEYFYLILQLKKTWVAADSSSGLLAMLK